MPAAEFHGMSVLGLPLDPAERVRDALALAMRLTAEACDALPPGADPRLASYVRYASLMTRKAAELAHEAEA